jgi:hypothetical protein
MKPRISDFPDWFGPMLVKELRQGLKTRGFVFSFIGLQIVLVLVMVIHVLVYARHPKDFDASGLGVIFWLLIGGLLIFVTPLRAFNELAAERKANTLELIFMSGLSAWRIAFGKWVSLLFQALLFLLAVLPFAILRYYFGAVDLAQDLQAMLMVMLACAVLSAVALAISGMPLWVRILVVIGAVFFFMVFSMGLVNLIVFSAMGRGSRWPFGSLPDGNFWLIGWDILLVCLIALQVAAASVAPLAENHAGRQRFLALLLWLPLPIMQARGVTDEAVLTQLFLFVPIVGGLVWYQLSVKPLQLLSHCRPFRGWRAFFGLPFQPGWPSAVVFLLLALVLYSVTVHGIDGRGNASEERSWLEAAVVMASASLLCSTAIWVVLYRKARFPLLFETLILILCGVAVGLIAAAEPSTTHIGEIYAFGFVPPMGVWAILDQPYRPNGAADDALVAAHWSQIAYIALLGYAVLLLLWSGRYWLHYVRTCFALSSAAPAPLVDPLPSPAPESSEP